MIYFCADDYGLCETASEHIRQCVEKGVLNKVSVFPNFDKVDLSKLSGKKDLLLSLHLNLVEGKCMASKDEIKLITDEEGNFRHTFGGLFALSLFRGKKLQEAVYKEIKAQVSYWMSILPENATFGIDSHQHTHMIPLLFDALIRVLDEEGLKLRYIRIPSEPLSPFLKAPSLYFTYSPVNMVKQWLLKLLGAVNKKKAKKRDIPTACFFGILFSGKMDEKRVMKILPTYKKLAEKKGTDTEVLFHPGYLTEGVPEKKNIVFKNFYLSEGRKTEFDSVIKLSERGVR